MAYIRRPLHPHATRQASVFGRQVIATNSLANSSGTTTSPGGNTAGGTMRVQYTTGAVPVTDIQVVFQNWASGSQSGEFQPTSAYSINHVVLEIGGGEPNQYLYFPTGGLLVQIAEYETAVTVPYKIYLPPFTTFFIRYYWTCAANSNVPLAPSAMLPNTTWNNFGVPAGPDITANSGSTGLTQNLSSMFGMPTAILGTPGGSVSPVTVGLFGDSLFDTSSASQPAWVTWPIAPLLASGINVIKASIKGDLASGNILNSYTRCRNMLLSDCDVVIVGFGTNDLIAGASAAQIISYWKIMWARYFNMGCQVYQTTIVPQTTGTFTTAAGQTPTATDPIRQVLNAYLRAPASAGAGASAAADVGNVLSGIIDVAALAETDVNNSTPSLQVPNLGGRWWAGPGNNTANTPDGIHPTAAFCSVLGGCMPLETLGRRLLSTTVYT